MTDSADESETHDFEPDDDLNCYVCGEGLNDPRHRPGLPDGRDPPPLIDGREPAEMKKGDGEQ